MKKINTSVFVFLFAMNIFSLGFPQNSHAQTNITASTSPVSVDSKTLIKLTNAERVKNNLSILQENTTLDKVAQLKAENMVSDGYFAHTSPSGNDPWHWFKVAGYKFWNAGENLAILFETPQSVVDAWMNSPTHRANVLSSQYTEIGMAVVRGAYKGVETDYIVEVFGKPQAAQKTTTKTQNLRKLVRVTPKQNTNLVTKSN